MKKLLMKQMLTLLLFGKYMVVLQNKDYFLLIAD